MLIRLHVKSASKKLLGRLIRRAKLTSFQAEFPPSYIKSLALSKNLKTRREERRRGVQRKRDSKTKREKTDREQKGIPEKRETDKRLGKKVRARERGRVIGKSRCFVSGEGGESPFDNAPVRSQFPFPFVSRVFPSVMHLVFLLLSVPM